MGAAGLIRAGAGGGGENLPESGSWISVILIALIAQVSDDSDVVVDRKVDPVHNQSPCVGDQLASTSCSAMGNAQELINRETLQQLQSIGKRLDNFETKKYKKDRMLQSLRVKANLKNYLSKNQLVSSQEVLKYCLR